MPRKFLKKYLPSHQKIKEHKSLQIFGDLLHEPNLWHMNRHSVAGAIAVGLFFAWVPVPFQMVLAAGMAILIHTNLPISVATVWVSNPVTMPPLFYGAYVLGTWILGTPEQDFTFALTFDWLGNELLAIWKPFLTGCFTLGVFSAVTGYIAIQIAWRWSVMRRWHERRAQRR